MGEEQKKRRIRRKFSDEFKRDAVEIVRASGKPIAEVARELGIYDTTLGNCLSILSTRFLLEPDRFSRPLSPPSPETRPVTQPGSVRNLARRPRIAQIARFRSELNWTAQG